MQNDFGIGTVASSSKCPVGPQILVNQSNLVAIGVDIRDHLALGSSRFTCLNWIGTFVANGYSSKFSTTRPLRILSLVEEFPHLLRRNVYNVNRRIDCHGYRDRNP